MSEKGHVCGVQFLTALKSGALKKECRPNHGNDFTGGQEELHKARFCNYVSSCASILMDERLKASSRRGYYG